MKSWFTALLPRSIVGASPARRVKAPFPDAFRARSLLCATKGSCLLVMALLAGSHAAVQGSEQPELRPSGTADSHQTQMRTSSPLAMWHPTAEMSRSGRVAGQKSASRVLFVDSGVAESQMIVAAAAPEVAVVVLNAQTDGIKQIADHVRDLRDLESISIVSHGNPGALALGNSTLHHAGLAGYQQELAHIGAALKPQGELLLYGCSVGRGAMGQAFLSDLAQATGAVLGASNNVTGGAAQGGDWTLEVSTAVLSTAPALDVGKLASYGHILAKPTYSSATAYIGEQFVTLSFDVALDASHPPAPTAFVVDVNGGGVSISGVEINSTDKSVKITFTGPTLVAGDTIDFCYQDPTGGDDVNAIQGLDGTDADTFSVGITVLEGRPALSAPSVATLDSGSDSGTSGDNITHDDTPTVSGTAEAGATVKLYDTNGTTLLGTTTADGSGHWSVTSNGLSDGSHTLKTTQTNTLSQTSALSTGLTLTIDTVGPVGMALSATHVAVANATNGATLATLSSTDTTSVAYAFAVGNGTTDADNGRFSISGTSLIAAQNLSAGSYHIYLKATDAAGNDAFQSLTLTVVAAPAITSVAVPAAASYGAGDSLDFTVNYDSAVTVTGTPRLALTIGGKTRYATYVAGSSTATALVFRYVPQWGDLDTDGIEAGSTLELNGGTINSTLVATAATLALNGVASTTGLRVDAGPLPALEAYLKSSHTAASQYFGAAIAVSGDTAVVGAYREASAAGAAYIFTRSGTTWTQQARLTPSNAEASDQFGVSVAISGDTVVVGAFGEDSAATGVDGNQADNSASGAGAAYIFTRSGTTWTQQAYLKASNAGASDQFGSEVAISGDTVVVTAEGEDSAATGVEGNQADNSVGEAGAAYVFTRSGSTWTQQAYLKASNPGADDGFGYAVDVSGDTVVVGAIREDSSAAGVNGDQANDTLLNAGAAYVFARSGSTWTQQAYLKASNPGASDLFGSAVAISGDTLVVGANNESSNASGVNGDQANDAAGYAGAAYVFTRSGTTWSQQAYLKASNVGASDRFGKSVGISGDTLVVGAHYEASSATGVNGSETDNSAAAAGAVYVFARNGTTWSQQAYLKASNTGASDGFGENVAVSAGTVIVGATYEDSSATGVNGNGADNSAANAGAAYAFALSPPLAVTSVTVPPAATYGNGQTLSFTLNYNGAVTVTGTPRLALTIGATTRYATYDAAGSTSTALKFTYTVQAGDTDLDGIALAAAIDLNSGTIQDSGLVDAVLTLPTTDTAGVVVDPRPYPVTRVPADNATGVAPTTDLVLTFAEPVTAVAGKNLVIKDAADDHTVATIAVTDAAQVSISGAVVTVNPTAALLYSTSYYVQIDAGAFKNAADEAFPGYSTPTAWNFTTEARASVTASDAAEFVRYFANPSVSTINLTAGATYAFPGGSVARTLTIDGHGATLQAGAGVTDDVIRTGTAGGVTLSGLGDYPGVQVFLKVTGSLTLRDVTLQNNGTNSAAVGFFAVINVKNGGSLVADGIEFRDFHNNPTPGTNLCFGLHTEPLAGTVTVTDSTFGSSNAFRNAFALRGGTLTVTGNTFAGTAHPERLKNDDGYEYALYLYGGSGTIENNTISGYDSTTQSGYASSALSAIGFFNLNYTIRNNTLSGNSIGIDVTRQWSSFSSPTPTVTINGVSLEDSEDAYDIGRLLESANNNDKVSVSLDQNDEVELGQAGSTYFAVLGGYRSPFLTVSDKTSTGATLNFPTSTAVTDVLRAATAINLETRQDEATTWSAVPGSLTGIPTTVPVTYTSGHVHYYRVKFTHGSYVEASDPVQRTLITYSAPVSIDVRMPAISSSLTASGALDTTFSYQVAATNTPTSYAATGLPAGLSLNNATGAITGSPTQAGTFNVTLAATNGSGTGPSSTLVLTIAKGTATVTLGSLSQTYNGQPRSATATTSPPGLSVSFLYNGSMTAPSAVGSYNVQATINDADYDGSSAGTLTISAATATISLGNLLHTYDGSAKNATVTTSPSGLAVAVTYDGSATAPTAAGSYAVVATVTSPGYSGRATGTLTIQPAVAVPPVVAPGSTTTISAADSGLSSGGHWQRNGKDLSNATGLTLTLPDVQPPTVGLYTYTATAPGGGSASSEPVIVGLSTTEKVIGTGEVVGADIVHPNGNVYDQLLLEGKGATLMADKKKVTRISFVDLSNDIVQVEFSGAGSLSVVMDDAGTPAPAELYNQPGVDYVKGHVGLVITGADETSNVSVFSVGRYNAVNQALFREGVNYDGVADIAFIAVQSKNGKFGGIRTGNVSYFASSGFTGIYAPGVEIVGPVNVGDIAAYDAAQPVFVIGSAEATRITGGSLHQPNGTAVQVAGLTRLQFVVGTTSQGAVLPAQHNRAVLKQDGVDVTDLIVVNP